MVDSNLKTEANAAVASSEARSREADIATLLSELDELKERLDRRLVAAADGSDFAVLIDEMRRLWSDEQVVDAHHVLANRGTRFAALIQSNWAKAVARVYQLVLAGEELTEGVLKDLHSVLFRGIAREMFWADEGQVARTTTPGTYRTSDSYATHSEGVKRYFSPGEDVPHEMSSLLEWYHASQHKLHPVVVAARFSVRLTSIHPFADGNGRIARLASNYILLEAGYPPVIFKTKHAAEHLAAQVAGDDGRYEPLILLMKNELEKTVRHFLALLSDRGAQEAVSGGG